MKHVLPAELAIVAGAAVLTAVLIVLLRPLLQRYALARPNARSSHKTPTPQGGGIAVIASVSAIVLVAMVAAPRLVGNPFEVTIVLGAAGALALVGAIDDIRPLDAWPRLVLQALAVAIMIAVLPASLRVVPILPWWLERAVTAVAVLWLVNLVNFMDGIDWMTVAEVVPVTAALAYFGWRGALPTDATIVAIALCGAMLGFAPFNRPVARLFLGDVGSLPIGLLLGWLLILLGEQHLASAMLLPLYYIADATITLLRRLMRGDQITQAHRNHFYQQAVDGGMGVREAVGRVFVVNIALAVLASAALHSATWLQVLALLAGAAVVGALLADFAQRKRL